MIRRQALTMTIWHRRLKNHRAVPNGAIDGAPSPNGWTNRQGRPTHRSDKGNLGNYVLFGDGKLLGGGGDRRYRGGHHMEDGETGIRSRAAIRGHSTVVCGTTGHRRLSLAGNCQAGRRHLARGGSPGW